jgi:kynureninase
VHETAPFPRVTSTIPRACGAGKAYSAGLMTPSLWWRATWPANGGAASLVRRPGTSPSAGRGEHGDALGRGDFQQVRTICVSAPPSRAVRRRGRDCRARVLLSTVELMTGFRTDRAAAVELDAADPLASLRDEFIFADPGLIYLDGNSLGRLPRATAERIGHVVRHEWGTGLIGSWDHWIGLPMRAGDLLGEQLLGAAPGQVLVCDNTTVNLYKLANAALDARPGRSVVITDDDNFPTDRYVLEGVARQRGLELRLIHADIDTGLAASELRAALADSGAQTALVSLSHVAYRSGAVLDMAPITQMVHDTGAMMLWDLCHSAGAVQVELDASGADLAAGCTYKYLNAGPGSPAFLYVRHELQDQLRQPVWGWFGQRDQFGMGPRYDPVHGIGQFLTGTPPVTGIVAVEEGARLLAKAGIGPLRAKGMRLTSYLIALADAWLVPLGCAIASPRDPELRGSHVCIRHPEADRITAALAADGVVGDYRTPSRLRLGPAPATTRYADVWDAMDRLRRIVRAGGFARPSARA